MSFKHVGVYYDSETVKYHLNHLKSRDIDLCTWYTDQESFLATDCRVKIAFLHVPYPLKQEFAQKLDVLKTFCDHVYVLATEVHPEIVSVFRENDYDNITYYICGLLNFDLKFAKVKQFMDWFETSSYFYRHWLPEILTRLRPFEIKSKSFDILLGRKKLHRDQIYIHYAMGPDIGEITYFNDNKVILDKSDAWIWEGKGVKILNPVCWTVDKINYFGHEMSLSQVIPIDIYNRTAYTAISETCFDDNFAFFTEKTAKPIIAKRLFVMFAGKHYLKNLQALGFKTFDGIIDEAYDQETDSLIRWRMAYEQMVWLSNQQQEKILEQIRPIVEHNFNHIMTTNWAEEFRHTLEQDIVRIIDR